METLFRYTPLLAQGALVTIALALASLALATLLGGLGAWARLSRSRPARIAGRVYTTLVRGVPDLVMVLLIFFGGQRLINTAAAAADLEPIDVSAFAAGVFTIGFIFGAYLTETFRGAYLAIPSGQTDAAQALGLRRWRTLVAVIGPQLARHALPGYGNVWLVLLKSTAVVSVIGLDDLVGLADKAAKSTREPFTFFLAVIFVFLAMTSMSNWVFRRLETRYAPVERVAAPA